MSTLHLENADDVTYALTDLLQRWRELHPQDSSLIDTMIGTETVVSRFVDLTDHAVVDLTDHAFVDVTDGGIASSGVPAQSWSDPAMLGWWFPCPQEARETTFLYRSAGLLHVQEVAPSRVGRQRVGSVLASV